MTRSISRSDEPWRYARDEALGATPAAATSRRALLAGLPKSWIVGDETGTGGEAPCLGSAIVWPPGRPPILVAA
jgi:beta-lactamase class A